MFVILAFFFSACSHRIPGALKRPQDLKVSADAGALLSVLETQNFKLKTLKGTGRITFQENEKNTLSSRMAWVVSTPDRLRIALQNIYGQPLASAACDGHWLYLYSHIQGRYYKQRASSAILKHLLPMSITAADVVRFLAGRIPVRDYLSAGVETPRSENGFLLILKNRHGNIVEKVYFDKNKRHVYGVELFRFDGSLDYRVKFHGNQVTNGYQMPSRLVFSNTKGTGFELDIDRCWTDIRVSSSIFVLAPPE